MDIKGLCATCANHSRLLDGYGFLRKKITKSQVAILMYHRVCDKSDNWSLEPFNPQNFERQIEYFCRNCEIVPLEKLAQCFQKGKSLPQKALAITFDDGYKDNYLYAYPILKKYHIPATVFLATGHIGTTELLWWDKVGYIIWHTIANPLVLEGLGSYPLQSEFEKFHAISAISERLKKMPDGQRRLAIEKLLSISGVDIPDDLGQKLILSWDDVSQMSNDGISFGAHSVTHPILTNMPLEQAKHEIIQSKKDIERKLGKETVAFSYPNGDFNLELAKFIRESGFSLAVSVSPSKLINLEDDIYALSRIGGDGDFNKFKVIFCGLWEDLQNILQLRR